MTKRAKRRAPFSSAPMKRYWNRVSRLPCPPAELIVAPTQELSPDIERVFRVSMQRAGAKAGAIATRYARRIEALVLPEALCVDTRGYTFGGRHGIPTDADDE